MKIKTNDIETNYTIEGAGPWLTMSHSLACNLSMWDEQAKLLSKNFKVLRYDTRGSTSLMGSVSFTSARSGSTTMVASGTP